VFFPERIVGWSSKGDSIVANHSTLISDIQVNQPMAENTFRLRYPDGLYVTDDIRGVKYRVNSEGKPISAEEPVSRVILPPAVGDDVPSSARRETQEEPRSMLRWILPVSIGILVLGVVAALVRCWRRPAAEDSSADG
jgi:hypothetical protein